MPYGISIPIHISWPPSKGEFLGQAARNHELQRVFWKIPKCLKSLWEQSPQIPPSIVVGHCKQTKEFTLADSEVLEEICCMAKEWTEP